MKLSAEQWEAELRAWGVSGTRHKRAAEFSSLAELHPVARAPFERLTQRFRELRLPVVWFETFRTIERQNHLFATRKSKLEGIKGRHVQRAAGDLILSFNPEGGHGPWYTGVSKDAAKRRTIVEDAAVYAIWARVGELVREFPELQQPGGVGMPDVLPSGKKAWHRDGDLIGWDAYHVEATAVGLPYFPSREELDAKTTPEGGGGLLTLAALAATGG